MNVFKKMYYSVRYFPEISSFVKEELKRDDQQVKLKSINFDEKKLEEYLTNEKELSDIYFKYLLFVGSIFVAIYGFVAYLKGESLVFLALFIFMIYDGVKRLFRTLKNIRIIREVKRDILLKELGVKNSFEILEIFKVKYREVLAKKE